MTDEPTIRIRDGSLVTREEYDKSEKYVQEVQKAKANRQVKSDSLLDMTELSSRLRLLQRYHGDNDAGEAADALEAQERRIAVLEAVDDFDRGYRAGLQNGGKERELLRARIAELTAALKVIIRLTDTPVVDSLEVAIGWDEAMDAARAALGEKE